MRGEAVTGSLMGTPMICKTNADWAKLKKDGIVLNPDGSVKKSDDARDAGAHGCVRTGGGGAGGAGTNFQCN